MKFIKGIYHFLVSWLASVVYRSPSTGIFVLGVTGTKGKSTVLEIIHFILEGAGYKTAMLSSVFIKIGKDRKDNITENTMPGRFFIQKFLKNAGDAGCKYALIEVTSEGIVQHRHRFIHFDSAMFLNLHPEHIEAHGSYKKYRKAKVKFFSYVARHSKKLKKQFFINQYDKESGCFTDSVKQKGEVYTFSREQFIASRLNNKKSSLGRWFANDINLENAAAATRFAEIQGVGWETIKKILKSFGGFTGRMEVIQNEPFRVVIDYAHTPNSLEIVYKHLANKKGRMVCVLGSCGGGRDKWKRPHIGKIADKYCDQIILTNEDPYDEDPEAIINDIKSGNLNNPKFLEIIDRREAIKKAIFLAKKNDTVIITGKGSERWIHVKNGRKILWSDKEVVEQIFKL